MLNPNLEQYRILRSGETPAIEVQVLEHCQGESTALESNHDPAAHRLPDGMGMIRSEMDLRIGSRCPATGLVALDGFSDPLRHRSDSRPTR